MTKNQKRKLIESCLLLLITFLVVYYGDIKKNISAFNTQNREVEEVVNIQDANNLRVHFLDVGQADSILIEKSGEYMLIDAGNNEDGSKLVKYFKDLGIDKFKIVVGTHAHEDHIGGMDDIIKNFTIESFYMPDVITTTKTFEDVLDALEAKQIPFQTPEENSELTLSDSTIKVLSVNSTADNLNETSIVLRLQYKTTSFLFMGDAESKTESKILNKDIKSDVLKVGHHGSKTSTTLSFLNKVAPTYAIISVGKDNSYGHPSDTIMKRLNNKNIKIYRTDQQGVIIAESNGTLLNFSTIKMDTNG